VSMEVPTLRAGVLLEVLVKEGDTVPVGAPLAWLEVEGEDAGAAVAPEQVAAEPVAAEPVAAEPVAAEPVAARPVVVTEAAAPAAARVESGERRPSPLIRRLLEEAGLTAADVKPSGPGGRITREDVSAAVAAGSAAASTPAPAPPKSEAEGDHTQPLSRVRAVIAERMVTSLHTSAQLTSVVEVDVTSIAQLRARAGSAATRGVKLSYLPFFARAAVEALEAQPDLNASVDTSAGTVTHHSAIHLAVAVDTERGLLAPVIRDAGRLSLVGIALAIADVAARTRDGTITADELSGGTFTITNTGSRGALFDTPIINQPQVAILGTGAVVRRPVVVTDPGNGAEAIAIRSMAFLALTYDHRLIDGAAAAKFLGAVMKRLEEGRFSPDLGLSGS
jgi:pyruvate dehydrogenase E2 component (dihydrolipoamide acetyltransferase)